MHKVFLGPAKIDKRQCHAFRLWVTYHLALGGVFLGDDYYSAPIEISGVGTYS